MRYRTMLEYFGFYTPSQETPEPEPAQREAAAGPAPRGSASGHPIARPPSPQGERGSARPRARARRAASAGEPRCASRLELRGQPA